MMLPFSRPCGLTVKNESGSTFRRAAIRSFGHRSAVAKQPRGRGRSSSEKGASMKIAYMPDTHGGPYNQPEPSRDAAARFCDQLLAEGIEAERSGFDGIFLPERHHRTEPMFP